MMAVEATSTTESRADMSPQMHRVFRTTAILTGVAAMLAAYAAVDQVEDGASWTIRFLAVGSGMTPWLISSMIVWAAGEIIKVMKGADT
jgi:hypothetical protein